MTNDLILEMATPHFVRIEYDRGGDHECYEFSSDELFAFARLIAEKQREEDAVIAETSGGDQYEIAVSIREMTK